EGTGTTGFVRGEAVVLLSEEPAGTALTIDADAHVGGLLASVGQRMLAGVGRMLLGEFVKRVEGRLAG
ncbi:MAG: carbon monoxide dehydrogenase, partial [candidate division NC10 bacterium]|nr:carbon monoxide dehydrogenase [candidate division NC10 bacterium]